MKKKLIIAAIVIAIIVGVMLYMHYTPFWVNLFIHVIKKFNLNLVYSCFDIGIGTCIVGADRIINFRLYYIRKLFDPIRRHKLTEPFPAMNKVVEFNTSLLDYGITTRFYFPSRFLLIINIILIAYIADQPAQSFNQGQRSFCKPNLSASEK